MELEPVHEWRRREILPIQGKGVSKLRDDLTEGYNIIPNFFISARLNEELDYKEELQITDKQHTHFNNRQFDNRLFDRDTLLVCHYDVNFLYVVSLYARNNALQKDSWKAAVREIFRQEIQKILEENFQFHAMKARSGVNAESYIKEHFQELLGKIYTPYPEKDIYSLALSKDFPDENQTLLDKLGKYFIIQKCQMGEDPKPMFEQYTSEISGLVPSEIINSAKMYLQDLSVSKMRIMRFSAPIRLNYTRWKRFRQLISSR